MKHSFTLFVAILIFSFAIGQTTKTAELKQQTKMDAFASKTGTIIRFVDSKMPLLKTSYENAQTRVRALTTSNQTTYFYQIEKPGKYSSTTASIEYNDLIEVNKAIGTLKEKAVTDASVTDYVENKFVTVDGFEVGYLVDDNKVTWYLKLDKYGSDNTLFIKDEETIETAFRDAKTKIDELKK